MLTFISICIEILIYIYIYTGFSSCKNSSFKKLKQILTNVMCIPMNKRKIKIIIQIKIKAVAMKAASELQSEHRVLTSSEANSIGFIDVSGGKYEKTLLNHLLLLNFVQSNQKRKAIQDTFPDLVKSLKCVWEALYACLDIVRKFGYPEKKKIKPSFTITDVDDDVDDNDNDNDNDNGGNQPAQENKEVNLLYSSITYTRKYTLIYT